jgi:hypothetical protein
MKTSASELWRPSAERPYWAPAKGNNEKQAASSPISMPFSVMTAHNPSKGGRSSDRPMTGHPGGSACVPPKGFADSAPTVRETSL